MEYFLGTGIFKSFLSDYNLEAWLRTAVSDIILGPSIFLAFSQALGKLFQGMSVMEERMLKPTSGFGFVVKSAFT